MWIIADCRKQKCFSLSENLITLCEFDKNIEPQNTLAEVLEISSSTLATIAIQQAEIQKVSIECGKNSLKIRKPLKTTPLSFYEYDVIEWFKIVCAKNIAISGFLIKGKALQLHNVKDFSASNDWIDCFKKSYNIVQKKMRGKKAYANRNVVNNWVEKLFSLILTHLLHSTLKLISMSYLVHFKLLN